MTKDPHQRRKYLGVILVLFVLSLVLSPPTLGPGQAGAANNGDLTKPLTKEDVIVKLGQNLNLDGDVGVAVKDLRTGEEILLAEDREFDAASTMKLVIVGYMYHEASNNRFDLDEVLTIPAGDVQRYGTGSIQYEPAPHRYSYRDLARLMMEKSDNTAAYVLAKQLKQPQLQEFASAQGMAHTSLAENTTTARDMITFLERLQGNQLAEPGLTQELRSILDDSDFEDRLPAKLPERAVVYHKTGDAFNGGLHDAGIIESDGRTYAVAIFTQGLGETPIAAGKIADASKDIFDYMTR